MTRSSFLLYPDADASTKDAEGRVLLLDGDADLLDGRAFSKERGGDSCRDVLQEIRGNSHLPTDNTDEAGIVGRAFELVVLPCRSLNINEG